MCYLIEPTTNQLSYLPKLNVLECGKAVSPPFSKPVGGPTHTEYATNHNKLAARYHELYTQCHKQVNKSLSKDFIYMY